ncbi:MAG: ectonucleotide pyrophosphatase/phosphodiesterase [Wenzhouxiangella sp.]|jgi:predicted AlkP superfamily pyrophosphatase or phosphodiesterase|nr:ectonucleotide pyrophosphatase/phosphodiesterase [Wenzhouxiangella sp.]
MHRALIVVSLLALLLALSACHGTRELPESDRPAPLLLISIDGFRHDYFDLAETPALDRLVAGGLKADSLHHVFPTKTFPTHYSVVTGCYPGRHGVVANSMWDPKRDSLFSLGDRDAVSDGYWYDGCEPIWVTAENQGLTAATFFWPGSEARIRGVRPTHWKPYVHETPHLDRVQTLLDWVDLPADQRPDLLTLYFSVVDSAGHRHGPRADAVRDALIDVDRHLGILFDGLNERGLFDRMHIILVSDHGMSRVDFDQYIMLDDYLDLSRVRVSDWGPAAQIWATGMPAEEIVAALDGAHPHMRAWAREDIPARYRFDQHRRVPDVLAEADLEWMISNRPHMMGRRQFSLYGMHGWDPALLEMHGAFVIRGPGFAPGSKAPAVRSVDVYDLMAQLLGLTPADNDGSPAAFLPYLESPEPVMVEEQLYDCAAETLRARMGPAHMALHFGQQVHVLDLITDDGPRAFADTDLSFTTDGRRANVEIDGRQFRNCRLLMANR